MSIRPPTPRPPSPIGGGFPFVVALLVGIVLGVIARQPTLGFLGGAGAGLAILGVLWLRDRRRDGE